MVILMCLELCLSSATGQCDPKDISQMQVQVSCTTCLRGHCNPNVHTPQDWRHPQNHDPKKLQIDPGVALQSNSRIAQPVC